MTKHFRVIEGGASRPRYAKPQFERRAPHGRSRSGRGGRRGGRGDFNESDHGWTIGSLTIVLAVATFWGVWTWTAPSVASVPSVDVESASFGKCYKGTGYNCVIDGDTIRYRDEPIRIADIDTPETRDPGCASEAARGAEATRRMLTLINAGPFTLAPNPDGRDEDNYGRKLRIVTRGGESLGGVLVDEGLARWYGSGRRPWC